MSDSKYAILGDIHSNLEALETVLKDAHEHSVTSYVCVGDIVGYNANPAECLESDPRTEMRMRAGEPRSLLLA